MAGEKVTVVARIRAKAGLEAEVKRELLALLPQTRAEAGCLNYDLHQSRDDKTQFLLHENWVSQADLDKHLQMPYLLAWRAKAGQLLAQPTEVTLWRRVEEK